MKLKDLATLPKVRDSFSYLYAERCRIEQDALAIAIIDEQGTTSVPCANLTTLLLGPGSTITHSAIKTLADNGCLVMWAGEGAVRFYAQGLGETRSSRNLMRQAYLSSLPTLRLRVVRRMYELRFSEKLPAEMTLQQIRGREGVRVRTAYSQASSATGVKWSGRSYDRSNWTAADPVNRALSCANSCLYGVCHGAIISAGYSAALGFIHTGRVLSFVYDIADLYKAEITIPLAFEIVKESETDLESRVRHRLRDRFHETRFLSRIIPDIETVLDISTEGAEADFEYEDFVPGGLWNGGDTSVQSGINWASDHSALSSTEHSDKLAAEIEATVEKVKNQMAADGHKLTAAANFLEKPDIEISIPPAAAARDMPLDTEKKGRRKKTSSKTSSTANEAQANPDFWENGGQVF